MLGLCACNNTVTPVAPDDVLEFEICPEALALPEPKRAFQGLNGWFFFNHDFRETYETLTADQAAFVVELHRAFAARGTLLVVVPVPGRGAVRPQARYLADPKQASFSPAAIRAFYNGYVETLERRGVAVVNVLAEAVAFDASGGQTFFKRDLHWTPEGANQVAQATAAKIRERLTEPLPRTPSTLTLSAQRENHPGRFINNWLFSTCGYTLPPEPLGRYIVSPPASGSQSAAVVQTGSSLGGSPFDQGFLSVALQSEVANRSVGNGGVLLALESYLESDAYTNNRPRVLVWEFPASAQALRASGQRRLLAGVYGVCSGDAVRFEQTRAVTDSVVDFAEAQTVGEAYLTVSFSDLSLLHFEATLRYENGFEETLEFNRPEQIAERNRGRFFTTFADNGAHLERIDFTLPNGVTGTFTAQVCRTPQPVGRTHHPR